MRTEVTQDEVIKDLRELRDICMGRKSGSGSPRSSRTLRLDIRKRNRRVSYTLTDLRHNLDSTKSKARGVIAWIDEAETCTRSS
mgnify:CR=1 FL=1